MRFLGRIGLVALIVCLGLLPGRRAQAATITIEPTVAGVTEFSGTFEFDNDLVLIPFEVSTLSLFSAEVTAGFEPILTLFGPEFDPTLPLFEVTFQAIDTREAAVFDPIELELGNYLLAITQYNKLFDSINGVFDYAGDSDEARHFTTLVFTPTDTNCKLFVSFDGECGTGAFSGTVTVEPTAVPEPGTLSLLALGGAALVARRRRKRDGS